MKPTLKIAALLLLVTLLVAGITGMSFWSFSKTQEAAEARKHISVILGSANHLMSALKDAETGQRGYLLTGDPDFLAPYLEVRNSLVGDLKLLHEQTGISAARQHLDAMAPLIDKKLGELARSIELRRNLDIAGATAMVSNGTGKHLMDALRVEMTDFIAVEEAALLRYDSNFQASLNNLFIVIIAASLLTLLFVISLVTLIYRETRSQLKSRVHAETRRLFEIQEAISEELRLTNATLKASEGRLAATLNSIGDGVIVTDHAGLVTRMNPPAERLTGWSDSQARGQSVDTVFRIVDRQTRVPLASPVSVSLGHGTPYESGSSMLLIARDGSESCVADSCAPIVDGDARLVGAVLVFRDTTSEELAHRSLREVQARSNFALAMSHIGGWELDIATGCVHRTIEYARIFGHDSIDPPWTFELFMAHVLAQDRAGVEEILSSAIAAQGPCSAEFRIRRADGEIRNIWLASEFQPGVDGKPPSTSGIVRDVTDMKIIDAERVRHNLAINNKNVELTDAMVAAARASLAKSEFLSSMSHELRSPLNAILGFAQLLDSDSPPISTDQKNSVDQILHAGWYLLELINEILDLAAVESGRLTLSSEPVSLAEAVHECRKMIEPLAHKRGISVEFPTLDFLPFVTADRTRLKQVLINLLSNAIKYNREHGSVQVTYASVAAGRIRVSVKDTGAGLPADKLAQLFQPFNRLGQESGTEEGTGIGLVMSKRLVEMMGGAVGVDSTEGRGSVFWFELDEDHTPRIALEAIQLSTSTDARDAFAEPRATVLYIEDNPANLMLVEKLIARRPELRLLTAVDGRQGIALARERLPAVILMDINLPGISGIQAMKILHEDPLTAHIPILAISANAMASDIKRGMEAGFYGYLTKPIRVNEFMTALDAALAVALGSPA